MLAGALESISSKHKPRHSEIDYWLGVGHQATAEVVANDTKFAREALSQLSARTREVLDVIEAAKKWRLLENNITYEDEGLMKALKAIDPE